MMGKIAVFLVLAGLALPAAAADGSGLPLPRFVSLRATEVNLRTGPGVQYPVDWVYQKRNLPVEVIAEFKTWRKIRDWQGAQGWVHQTMLGQGRFVMVLGELRTLRNAPAANAVPVARAEPGVIARLVRCPDSSGWCQVEAEGRTGWLHRNEVWGVLDGEVVE